MKVPDEGLLGRVNRLRTYRALGQGFPTNREVPTVDQKEKGVFRRWFGSNWAELVVWYKDDRTTLTGFHLAS